MIKLSSARSSLHVYRIGEVVDDRKHCTALEVSFPYVVTVCRDYAAEIHLSRMEAREADSFRRMRRMYKSLKRTVVRYYGDPYYLYSYEDVRRVVSSLNRDWTKGGESVNYSSAHSFALSASTDMWDCRTKYRKGLPQYLLGRLRVNKLVVKRSSVFAQRMKEEGYKL